MAHVVLLVEDDEDARFIYRSCLRHASFEVIEAPTARDAVEAAMKRRPDIVVLDRRLPDRDGLTVIAEDVGDRLTAERGPVRRRRDPLLVAEEPDGERGVGADELVLAPLAPGQPGFTPGRAPSAPRPGDLAARGSAERMESPPTQNRQAFVDQISRFLTGATVEMVIHDTFARGSVVVNIHQQLFEVKGQGPREDWYIGVFHLVDGKVREWNDYAIIPFSAARETRPAGFGTFVRVT